MKQAQSPDHAMGNRRCLGVNRQAGQNEWSVKPAMVSGNGRQNPDASLHAEIKELKKQLDQAVATHGIRHTEIDRIMAKLDPLIAQAVKVQAEATSTLT